MLTELEQKLAHFNRKERFLLVGQALGNPGFTLGAAFRDTLAELLGRPVPQNAYCAMDYHLDWLFAAVTWAEGKVHPGNLMPREFDPSATGEPECLTVTGNQSDIDLLIAWTDRRDRGQIALLEAKGFSGWSNKQMGYKLARLGAIFGEVDAPRFEHVDVHLVLVGPKPPTGLKLVGRPGLWVPAMVWPSTSCPLTRLQPKRSQFSGSRAAARRQWLVPTGSSIRPHGVPNEPLEALAPVGRRMRLSAAKGVEGAVCVCALCRISRSSRRTAPPARCSQRDPLPGRSGHDITASREYWRVTMPANSQTD